eukprot:scaffold221418_cov54-Attheya_sp.AAC.2
MPGNADNGALTAVMWSTTHSANEEHNIDSTSTVDAVHGAKIIEEIQDSYALKREVAAKKKKSSKIEEDKRRKLFVVDAFEEVRSFPQLCRHWISATVFADAMNKRFCLPTSDNEIVSTSELNRMLLGGEESWAKRSETKLGLS